MNKIFALTLFGGLFLVTLAIGAVPNYTGWMNDYTGSEANTIALWKFDNDPGPGLNSYSGSDYTAYGLSFAENGVQTGVEGKFGQAFYSGPNYSTASDYGWAYTANGSNSLFNASAMSVEFWFKPLATALGNSNATYLFDQVYTTANGMRFSITNSGELSNALSFTIGKNSVYYNVTTASLDWDVNTWYHLAVTFENVDGDGYLRIYRDGEMLAETIVAEMGDMVQGSRRYRIGNRGASTYYSGPGYYDNFRISDVAYEYSAAIPEPLSFIVPGLVLVAMLGVRRKKLPVA